MRSTLGCLCHRHSQRGTIRDIPCYDNANTSHRWLLSIVPSISIYTHINSSLRYAFESSAIKKKKKPSRLLSACIHRMVWSYCKHKCIQCSLIEAIKHILMLWIRAFAVWDHRYHHNPWLNYNWQNERRVNWKMKSCNLKLLQCTSVYLRTWPIVHSFYSNRLCFCATVEFSFKYAAQ